MSYLRYAAVALLLLSGCQHFRPGFISENYWEVGEHEDSILREEGDLPGRFDDEGNYIPENPDVEMTYKIPDIGAGFLFDFNTMDLTPSLQIELIEFDSFIPYVGTLKIDAGVAYQRSFIYIGKLWTSIFEISTGGFFGWNWEDGKFSYGVDLTIIKF